MKNIALFIKDFKKGTEISSHLVDMDIDITFSESIYDLPDHCEIAIIDLNEEKFANKEFITEIKNQSGITLIGYIDKVTKGLFDDYKSDDFETFNIGEGKINVPKNSLWCGNIPMLCASTNYLISDIKIKNNYIFLISEEKNIIKFINRTSYYDMIDVNDNLKIK